jgi:type IV secretory pathway VirB10-like protein
MAPAKARRLKVYQAPFGFHESVVAAPSQTAALRAWGSHQNLFAEGLARVTTDATAVEAALKHPETPLRRAIGSNDPFELEATSLPKVPRAEKERIAKQGNGSAKTPKPAPPPPDRSALDQAERELGHLEERRRREEERFSRRWDELRREQEEARREYGEAKGAADKTLKAALKAYLKAGGTD